jgi:hypothetical protein
MGKIIRDQGDREEEEGEYDNPHIGVESFSNDEEHTHGKEYEREYEVDVVHGILLSAWPERP